MGNTLQNAINGILKMNDPKVKLGMKCVILKYYDDNHLEPTTILTDTQRIELCRLLADYIIDEVGGK